MRHLLAVALATSSIIAPLAQAAPGDFPKLKLTPVWNDATFKRVVWLEELPDKTGRRWAVEQGGKILLLSPDTTSSETSVVLDISDRKPHKDNEEGLLGIAIHPNFKAKNLVYTYYSQQKTDSKPRRSVVSEWKVKADFTKVDPDSERVIMEITQPFGNHNGGQIGFGPDKMLYIALGDGGAANDPHDNGQKMSSLLGKFLRIDVDGRGVDGAYGIPKDNPFVGKEGVKPEIWAYGLRNPWRFSFDRKDGRLWTGDVGQGKWEEISIIDKGGNYGWRVREGFKAFKEDQKPTGSAPIDPVIDYPHIASKDIEHSPGVSVTGGYVYRGEKIKELQGAYLYGDFGYGTIWALREKDGKATTQDTVLEGKNKEGKVRQLASFAEDAKGELYTLVFEGGNTGKIYRIDAAN